MPGTEDNGGKAAHLQMIQGVITRMAGNSFALKTLSVTLAAAVTAYSGAVPTALRFATIGGILSIVVFWLLDAQYLRLERLFRYLYDQIRAKETTDYSMGVSEFLSQVESTPRIAFSWSVLWMYLALIVFLLLLFFSQR